MRRNRFAVFHATPRQNSQLQSGTPWSYVDA
jgi:hypothetical protein